MNRSETGPSAAHDELARRLRRVDLLLLRAVQRQRARPAVHDKGQYWGQFITDDGDDKTTSYFFQLVLKGLAPVGQNVSEVLREGIGGYRNSLR